MHMYTISMGICHQGQAMPHSQTSSNVQTPSVESKRSCCWSCDVKKRSFRHHMPSLCQVMICNWRAIEINRHPSMRGHWAGATSQHLSVISHMARKPWPSYDHVRLQRRPVAIAYWRHMDVLLRLLRLSYVFCHWGAGCWGPRVAGVARGRLAQHRKAPTFL